MTQGTQRPAGRKKTRRKPERAGTGGNALLRAGGAGFLLGVGLLFAFALLLAGAALKSPSPQAIVFPAAMIAVFAGGYGGALLSAKKAAGAGLNPFLGGLVAGGALLLFLFALSLFFPSSGERGALHRFAPLLVLLIAAALGSLTAAAHRPSQKRKLKKLTAGKRR